MKVFRSFSVSAVAGGRAAFTLLELAVVLATIAVLAAICVPVLASTKGQTRVAQCAGNVRQLALACQIYANDNRDRLPVLTGSAAWAWDLPDPAAKLLLKCGTVKKTFYCPGRSPRFNDKEDWAGRPGLAPTYGPSADNLWNFGQATPVATSSDFHIVGYTLAFSGASSLLSATNQNTSIQAERITLGASSIVVPVSERVLVADAIISQYGIIPGYLFPANNYVSISGGFQQNGVQYPHVSPHLKGVVPAGGNLGFKDGHVAWRKFELMRPRSISGAYFWW